MNRHGTTCGLCCFAASLGLLLALAFGSAAEMILAFLMFLMAVWVTVPAPLVEDEPDDGWWRDGIRFVETPHVELQREFAKRGWQ